MHDFPKITDAILALIPNYLRSMLTEYDHIKASGNKPSLLISSNSLANRFILEKWRIRSSQRKKYPNLFRTIRKFCRALFEFYLRRGYFGWKDQKGIIHIWGLYKYDKIRGNLIINFVKISHCDPFLRNKIFLSF